MSDAPTDLLCPISKDLMNDPMTVTHQGADYHFDRVCLETWKTTPGGDTNPLSGLTGFREAPSQPNLTIKAAVREFRLANGMETDVDTEKVELQPFSDYQQIQDDEAEALRLHRELNGPPPQPTLLIDLFWQTVDGQQRRTLEVHPFISYILTQFPQTRNSIMNLLSRDAMNGIDTSMDDVLRVAGQYIANSDGPNSNTGGPATDEEEYSVPPPPPPPIDPVPLDTQDEYSIPPPPIDPIPLEHQTEFHLFTDRVDAIREQMGILGGPGRRPRGIIREANRELELPNTGTSSEQVSQIENELDRRTGWFNQSSPTPSPPPLNNFGDFHSGFLN